MNDRLDAELRDHIERQVADRMAGGMSESDARRSVRSEVGRLEQVKELCRDVRPLRWLDELNRDVRVGFRGLARDRLFALSVSIILVLGIGTSVAMFSVLHTIVLRPLPYANPSELAMLTTHLMAQNRPDGTSLPNLQDWRRQSRTFAGMTFYRRTSVSVVTFAGIDAPQRAQEGLVGPDFFDLVGTPPLIGRTFSPDEFERRERVVVLSEGLWQEQFLRSDAVLGRALVIDGANHTIIGVMPRSFQLPNGETRFWRPVSLIAGWGEGTPSRDGDAYEVIGRLAANVPVEDAQNEMSLIGARLRETYTEDQNLDIRVIPLFDHVIGSRTRRGLWLGFAAVLSLLAIAGANVGGLLSVRAARRRRELAVRSALGAGRVRLVRQLLGESISLWLVASSGGVLLAYGLIQFVSVFGPRALPRIEQLGLDLTAVVVAFLAGLIVVTICGTIPSLFVAKIGAAVPFGTCDQSALPRQRLQDVLVTAQIAGALTLLVCAVLFTRSFLRANGEDPGYPADDLLVVRIDLPRSTYPDATSLSAFFHQAQERIGGLPGVVAIGAITDFFIRRNADQRVTIEGRAPGLEAGLPRLAIEGVTPGFFRAVGIEQLEGREFDERDFQPNAPRVVIVSESIARRLWPDGSALGKQLVSGSSPPKDGRWSTVIGVVKDIKREGLDVNPIQSVFVPSSLRGMDLTIRAAPSLERLIPSVRREIRAIDPSLAVGQITRASGRLSDRISGRRFESQLLGLFAALALVLSAAGLYALLAYQVALRAREIGIRSALGADRRAIVSMVFRRGVRLAAIGALVGIALAVSVSRAMTSLLYGVEAVDAPSYLAAATCILVIAFAASWLPAVRAARVSPMTALRQD